MVEIVKELEFSLEQQEIFESILESSHGDTTSLMLKFQDRADDDYSQPPPFNEEFDDSEEMANLQIPNIHGGVVVAVEEASSSQDNDSRLKRLRVIERSKEIWEHYSDECPEEEFKKVFRMSKVTFNMICDELDSTLNKKDTMFRLAIPVRQRVAVCLYRLAAGANLRTLSNIFGLGISTYHKLVLEVCAAIGTVLMPKFLQWPDKQCLEQIKTEFGSITGIPNISGSVYTTRVSIIAPKANPTAYFNKKHTEQNQKPSYLTTVQGVVDSRGVFTDVCIGLPGSLSDKEILEKSALSERFNSGYSKNTTIVGSSTYALLDWLFVPYTHQNQTWNQRSFNKQIGEAQQIAKDAFMRLKGRWAYLQKRTEVKLQDMPVVLGACCVLHNICEIKNEAMDDDLKFDLFD
ncbi:putative harbinger transposase-derived nuclease domain-containing protein [Helianthus debilis subsp. tardiflorus]